MTTRAAGRAGFTLIEVVAAFLMTVLILFFVTNVFVENGRQRDAATSLMRERLSAAAALDQLASDLAGAVFLQRGPEEQPDDHPWRFVASSPSDLGATAFRFVTQAGPRTNPASGSSAWVEVAYFLAEGEDGSAVLWRWRSPHPPSEAPSSDPDPDDPGSMRVVLDVAAFGVRWLDAEGAWVDEWDSTFTPPEQAMPEAAEISLQLMRKARPGEATDDPEATLIPGLLQTRRVAMVMRPLDAAALIALASEDANAQPDCFTVDQCLAAGDSTWYQELLADGCGGDDRLCELLRDSGRTCWSDIETTYPAVAARAPQGCAP
ncbi:MAG: type II secretion system protein GspJ [Myxococcota bacterium]